MATVVQAGERRSAPVESMRALAALAVLAFHAQLVIRLYDHRPVTNELLSKIVSIGSQGVFLFFTLTGYLLFRPFAQRAWGSRLPVDVRRYALNRVLRILPLYYFAIVVLLLAQEHGGTFTQWWRFGLFMENFSHLTNNTVDGPLWSVVVEVQFYVLLPVLAWLVARGRLRTGGIVLGNLVVLSTAGFAIAAAHGATDDLVWRTSLPVTFFFFTPGLLLAWLEIWWTAQPRRGLPSPLDRATVWFVASIAVWLVWRLVSGSPLEMLLAANFLAVGSCVLPLRGGWSMAFLAWRPLAMLGVASYSLYVWHVPILEAIEHWPVVSRYYGVLGLVGGALSIGAALVSYRLVEYPFLRLRRRWSRSAASATMPSGSAENPEPEPGEVDDGIDGHRDALRQQVVQAG